VEKWSLSGKKLESSLGGWKLLVDVGSDTQAQNTGDDLRKSGKETSYRPLNFLAATINLGRLTD
jgi:hypothetical protein